MSRVIAVLWQMLGGVLERRSLGMLAESSYRKAVEAAPQAEAESGWRLGRLLVARKRYGEALPILEKAVCVKADNAESWNTLGIALRETGDMDRAREAFDRALALAPGLIHAQNNLGNWLLAAGEPAQALEWFDKALAADPGYYEALNNRVVALLALGGSTDAEKSATEALKKYPDSAPLHLNLGNSYLQQGKGYLALQSYREALELEPGFEEAHFNCALLDGAAEHLGKAIDFLKKEIGAPGRSIDLLNRLAIAYMVSGSLDDAEKTCREILSEQPGFASAYVTLGNVVSLAGDSRQALDCYRRALELKPDDFCVHSNILFELNYLPDYSAQAVFDEHLGWAARHEQPLLSQRKIHSQDKDKNRRLRVGYVSPDFLSHPVGYLTRGIIRNHDRERFEVHCYAHVSRSDHITEDIKQSVDFWHDSTGLNDAQLAGKVSEDGIDILVDLTGHTAAHRLPMFARRPAPIQVTWVGYFHSTGMESIDYFITDPYTSPQGSKQFFSETPVCLPHTRFCYTPPEYAPPVADASCLKNRFITLGCFNKLAKMTDEVVGAWAEIMRRLPDARLLLKSAPLKESTVRERVHTRFAALGIAPDRVILRPASMHRDMLSEYAEIDIALDPFPYTGGITTFEALWMGVPVVTLARTGVVARQSASALSNLGLTDLIHETIPCYIDGVVGLASDQQRLVELRQSIRPMMERSPLCDIQGVSHDLEKLYRRMWHAWCDGGKLPSDLG